MKTASPELIDFLLSHSTCWRADLFTFRLQDGTIYRWTSSDSDVVVGRRTYSAGGGEDAAAPIVRRSLVRQCSGLVIDTLDVILVGPVKLGERTLVQHAFGGMFDGAKVRLDHLIGAYPGDTSLAPIDRWFEGRVAHVGHDGPNVRLRIKSDLELLSVPLPRYFLSSLCGHTVFSIGCGLSKMDWTATGTVASATAAVMVANGEEITGKAAGHFNLGCIKFTSGALAGQRAGVAAFEPPGSFVLAMPLKALPDPGDSIQVIPGCDRSRETCAKRFNNLRGWRGFSYIPSREAGSK